MYVCVCAESDDLFNGSELLYVKRLCEIFLEMNTAFNINFMDGAVNVALQCCELLFCGWSSLNLVSKR